MAPYDSDDMSRASSPLSALSRSPSPPPELRTAGAYPSPPPSSGSSQTDGMDSTIALSDRDGPPPAKRRRISERKPRTTEYLDLSNGQLSDEDKVQLDRLVNVLHKRRKIVVVAGAGISVAAGIPDFRSSNGLFNTLRTEHNLKGSGKHLFDASVYKDASSTSTFHEMVCKMSQQTRSAKPTQFHHMLATLAHDDRLLRLYTQNVDGIDTSLEPLATQVPLQKHPNGKWPKTVQLHGGLDKMVCTKCGDLSDLDADKFKDSLPSECQKCVEHDRVRTDIAGKRSHGIGRLRPRMVLYNEHNPDDEAIGAVTKDDLRKRPDAIIVVGTSLKIPGVKRIVREMCATVRDRRDGVAVWINNDPEPVGKDFEDCWDIVVKGKCDDVAKYAALRRWYEVDDSQEITEEEWNSKSDNVKVVINKTFKPVPTHERFRKAPASPDYSPIASRISSLPPAIDDSFTEEDSILCTPPTPSKSARSSPTKSKASAFDALKNKAPAASKAKGRPANSKNVKKAVTKPTTVKSGTATKKQAGRPQTKINQALKQTKTVSVTAKAMKTAKSPNKSAKSAHPAMQPVPPEDSRINVAIPSKRLSPNHAGKDRMKIGNVID